MTATELKWEEGTAADLTTAGRYAEGDDGVVCYTAEIGDMDLADVRAAFLSAYSDGHAAKCVVREAVIA